MIEPIQAVDNYLAALSDDRRRPPVAMRDAICHNLPEGFVEVMADMPSYVVPLSVFPQGITAAPIHPYLF